MAVFRKDHLLNEKGDLALYYRELTEILAGGPPSESMAEFYQNNVEDFQKHYVEIDIAKLERAVSLFKVVVDDLKKIKKKAQKPQRGR